MDFDYSELNVKLSAMISDVPHILSNLSNAAALLWDELDRLNWAGFYILKEDTLILAPFQGKPACIEIPIGCGVCGTAVKTGETQLVPDVHKFSGHIACDSASNSEIVIPLWVDGKIYGVLDIDSPVYDRFDQNDKLGLEEFARIIQKSIEITENFI